MCEKGWNLPAGRKEYKGIDLLFGILMDLGIKLCSIIGSIAYPKVAAGVDQTNLAR